MEGFIKALCGHVVPVPLSQGLFWPGGKRLCVPPLSSPVSKLLFRAVDASQAKGQRGADLPAPNQLLAQHPPKPGTTQGCRADSALGFNSTPKPGRMKKKNPLEKAQEWLPDSDGDQLRSAPQYPPGHHFINLMGFLMKIRSGFSQAELAPFPRVPGPGFPMRWKGKAARALVAPRAAPASWKHPGIPALPCLTALDSLQPGEAPASPGWGGLAARAR